MDRGGQLDRAQACLLGQLIGDALGGQVEFQPPERIRRKYPAGVRDLADGGTWNTIAGQPTDDSEMALALARSLIRVGNYDQDDVRTAYVRWLDSRPFDVGVTTSSGLQGLLNFDSQANGALMRISPLGIFGTNVDPDLIARYAREDAWITHPHEVTQDANVVFTLTISHAIRTGCSPDELYRYAMGVVDEHGLVEIIRTTLTNAATELPDSFVDRQGWVLIALQNAYYHLLNTPSFEEALVDTVGRGGDTDTNAAVCGALLGAVYGRSAIPTRWVDVVLRCQPAMGRLGVHQPRPEEYWPVDALSLAEQLLISGDDVSRTGG